MFKRPIQRYGDTPEPETRYQKAGQVWDERTGAVLVQAKNWRLMAFGSLLVSLVLAGGTIWQSTQSRVVPYVVEVDKQGTVQTVGPAIQHYNPNEAEIARAFGDFIYNVRSLSIDPVVVVHNWDLAYAFLTDHAKALLNDYERQHDPSKLIGRHTVEVQIVSVVRVSDTSIQVKWIERHVDEDTAARTERWTAILTYVHSEPKDRDQLNVNPLGIYIDGINWSRDLAPDETQGG